MAPLQNATSERAINHTKKVPLSRGALRGFTLIKLLVVIAIIGILASIVMMSLEQSRQKGRDAARKIQFQEIFKALELYYTDTSTYPDDGTAADDSVGDTFANIGSGFVGSQYFRRLPEESDRYIYCVSQDRRSMLLALDTEQDKGGSEYCKITRGSGSGVSGFGCEAFMNSDAISDCTDRF